MLLLRGRDILGPGLPPELDIDEAARRLAVGGSDSVLLVSKSGRDAHAAGMLRQAFGPNDIAVVTHTTSSPTRQLLISLCLAQLIGSNLGLAGILLRALEGQVATQALVTSVTRLSSPAPSLSQHLRSLIPGSIFAIDVQAGSVSSVSSPEWRSVDATTVGAWCTGGKADKLAEGLHSSGLPQVTAPESARPWGARAWAEMSTLADDPDVLVNRLSRVIGSSCCPHCGRRAGGRGCLFCGTSASEAPAPEVSLPRLSEPRQVRKMRS